jgi:uncharacterized protein (DUF302 family)
MADVNHASSRRWSLLSVAAIVLAASSSALAQSTKDACRPIPVVPLKGTEPPAKIVIYPPLAEPLATRGVVIIQFTGRLEQILGRFVESKLKGLTPDGTKEALKSMEGEQGFMIINIFDHGADLLMVGQRRKAKQYLIGNPLVAIQITRYDIRAALYAPLRVLVFESEPGRTVVEFDQPSTLFGQFGRSEVTAGAVESDGKLDRVIAKAAMT